MDTNRAACAIRFKVTLAEIEHEVDSGARKEFMRASLKLSSTNSSSSKVVREYFLLLRTARTNLQGKDPPLGASSGRGEAARESGALRHVLIENCMPTGGVDGDSSWARLYDPDPMVIMWEKESLALIRRGLDEPQDEDDETAEEADRWPG